MEEEALRSMRWVSLMNILSSCQIHSRRRHKGQNKQGARSAEPLRLSRTW